MNNLEIRDAINLSRLKYYEVAKEIGITQATFSVWLREELTGDRKDRVLNAIKKLTGVLEAQRGGTGHESKINKKYH